MFKLLDDGKRYLIRRTLNKDNNLSHELDDFIATKRRDIIINILLTLFAQSMLQTTDPCFCPWICGLCASRYSHKLQGKNLFHGSMNEDA